MEKQLFLSKTGLFSLLIIIIVLSPVSAQPERGGITGDWQIKLRYDERQMESILSFSVDKKGNQVGHWVNFWGLGELKDIKYEGNTLSFVRINRFRGEESTSTFTGSIKDGILSGTLSREKVVFKVKGKRIKRMCPAIGNWEMKVKKGDGEFMGTLVIKRDKEDKLIGEWQSQRGEHQIIDVDFKGGKLTFARKSKIQDRQWKSTFEGTVKGHLLSGAFTSDTGKAVAKGNRTGAPLIGKWDLEIRSDQGSRKQLLVVNPDLSGRYGPAAIEKIHLKGDQVRFRINREFGKRKLEMSFEGKLADKKLTGKFSSSRGIQKVTGQKRVRTQPQTQAVQSKKAFREPDAPYIATPPDVVEKMLELAKVKKEDLVYDLGCGDGRIVVAAAKKYGCKAVGYDISEECVKESRANVEKNNVGHLVRIERKDIFTLDLSEVDVVTLYLFPWLNVKLIPQLEKLKPGSRIVSHDFDIKGLKPDKVVKIGDESDKSGYHILYLWIAPLKKEDVSNELIQ